MGGAIDVSDIVPNILTENQEIAKGIDGLDALIEYGNHVKKDAIWDYKARDGQNGHSANIFGVAWTYDDGSWGGEGANTQFTWGENMGDASDFGNFHAGYVGRFVYDGEGISRITLYQGAGAIETKKDLLNGNTLIALKQAFQLMPRFGGNGLGLSITIPPQPPYGDEHDDYEWNTKGMNAADGDKD